jgi:hypothetical protein
MANLILNGSTSGSVTLSSPAVSGTTTLTLPTTSGTVITTGTPQSGSVLQVVQTGWAGFQGVSTSTFTDVSSGSLSITPKFSTSKILALVSVANCGKSTNNTYLNIRLLRNSTEVAYVNGAGMTQTTLEQNQAVNMNCLDSPATTSAITYKLQIASGNNNTQAWVNNYQLAAGTIPSTITLMEIAG